MKSSHNICYSTTGYIRRYRLAEMLGISLSTLDRKVRNAELCQSLQSWAKKSRHLMLWNQSMVGRTPSFCVIKQNPHSVN
jgi:hypothetical protein